MTTSLSLIVLLFVLPLSFIYNYLHNKSHLSVGLRKSKDFIDTLYINHLKYVASNIENSKRVVVLTLLFLSFSIAIFQTKFEYIINLDINIIICSAFLFLAFIGFESKEKYIKNNWCFVSIYCGVVLFGFFVYSIFTRRHSFDFDLLVNFFKKEPEFFFIPFFFLVAYNIIYLITALLSELYNVYAKNSLKKHEHNALKKWFTDINRVSWLFTVSTLLYLYLSQ